MRKIVLGLVLLLVLANVAFVASSYEPDVPVEELEPRWASAASAFVRLDGARVHYRVEGAADPATPPVVMLHGLASSLHTWDRWVELLADDFRLARLDLPAFGLTGPFGGGDYRVSHYVDFLDDFFAHLGFEQVDLVGHSFGGYVAWRYALERPSRVRRMVLVSAVGYPPKEDEPVMELGRVSAFRRLMRNFTPRPLVENMLREAVYDDSLVTNELVDRHFELLLREGNRDAVMSRMELPPDPERWDAIPKIDAPTLLLWGEEDTWVDPSFGERFAEDLPHAVLATYPDVGHIPQLELPGQTAARVRSFLTADEPTAEAEGADAAGEAATPDAEPAPGA